MKRVAFFICAALLILAAPMLLSLGNLLLGQDQVVPVYLTRYYLVKLDEGQRDFDVFVAYMQREGYQFDTLIDNRLLRFVNVWDGSTKNVLYTDIKTVLYAGHLATDYQQSWALPSGEATSQP